MSCDFRVGEGDCQYFQDFSGFSFSSIRTITITLVIAELR